MPDSRFCSSRLSTRRRAVVWLVAWATLLAVVGSTTAVHAQQDIDALVAALAGDDLLAVEKASQQLVVAGRDAAGATPRLLQLFAQTDTPRPIAVVLGSIATPTSLRPLVDALADEELTPRRNAAQIGLLTAGEDGVPVLVRGLVAAQTPVRRNSADLLGYIGLPLSFNALLRAAHQDPDPSVRQSAVWALSQIDSQRVRPSLAEIAMRDPDPDVRAEATHALQRLDEGFR